MNFGALKIWIFTRQTIIKKLKESSLNFVCMVIKKHEFKYRRSSAEKQLDDILSCN